KDEGLVHEMAPEVEQRAAPGLPGPSLRREAFEARLEASHCSERPVGHQLADGPEVRVPASVLIRAQEQSAFISKCDRAPRSLRIERERLVADDCQSQVEGLLGQAGMRVGWSRDGHCLGARIAPPGPPAAGWRSRHLA